MKNKKSFSKKQSYIHTKALTGFFIVALGMYITSLQFGFPFRELKTDVTGQYDVQLVQNDPIWSTSDSQWTHGTIPLHPFTGVAALGDESNEHFVVGGYCSMQYDAWATGGQFLFDGNGQHVATRNVCLDAGGRPNLCKHSGGCHNLAKFLIWNNSSFITQVGDNGEGRPAITYNVPNMDMLGRTFYGDHVSGDPTKPGEAYEIYDTAIANNVLIGVERQAKEEGVEFGRGQWTNVFYALPSMDKILDDVSNSTTTTCTRACSPPSTTGVPVTSYWPKYEPIVGIGEYFIARTYNTDEVTIKSVDVYKMPDANSLIAGQERPQLTDTLFHINHNKRVVGYAVDQQNSERILLVVTTMRRSSGKNDFAFEIYTKGENGLQLESTIPAEKRVTPNDISRVNTSYAFNPYHGLALSGQYITYGRCPKLDVETHYYTGCELVVQKNGVEMSVEPLPYPPIELTNVDIVGQDLYSEEQLAPIVVGVSISPSGKIIVTADTQAPTRDNRGTINEIGTLGIVYMYQIENFSQGQDDGSGQDDTNGNRNAVDPQHNSNSPRNNNTNTNSSDPTNSNDNNNTNSNDNNNINDNINNNWNDNSNGNENSNDNLNGNENDNANSNSNYNDNMNADATDDLLTPPQPPTQFPNDEVPEYASLIFPPIGTTDQYASPIHPDTGIVYMTIHASDSAMKVEVLPSHTYTHKVGFYRTELDTWAPFRFEGREDGSWIRGRAIADISYVSLPEEGEIIAYICESNDDGWLCGYEPVPGVWTLQSYSLSDIPEPPEDDGSHNSNGNENENNNTNDDPDDTGSVCDTCDEIGETECGGGLGFNVLGVDFGTYINRCELVDGCKKWVRAEECSDMCINGLCR